MVLHWYDLTCPYCYIAQQRNDELIAAGAKLVELGFQAHPDVPPEGIRMGPRTGPMYERIAREAEEAGLPLVWQDKLPNSRLALAAVEWTKQAAPDVTDAFRRSLFHAHFAGGDDIGDEAVLKRLAQEQGLDPSQLAAGLDGDSAFAILEDGKHKGSLAGVRGTPAWQIEGHLIEGLQPASILVALWQRHENSA